MLLDDDGDEAALVVDSFRRIVQGLRNSSHVAERELGVSGAQLFVLRELASEPGISIRRLSERTLTDPSSVSVVIGRLVERGYVLRRSDPLDARRSVLSVSKKGTALLARAPEPFQARLIAAVREMPRPRLRQLGLMLSEIVTTLEIAPGAAPLFFEESPPKKARSPRRAKN